MKRLSSCTAGGQRTADSCVLVNVVCKFVYIDYVLLITMNTITTEYNDTKFNILTKICCQQYQCPLLSSVHSSFNSNVYSYSYVRRRNLKTQNKFLSIPLVHTNCHENGAFPKRSSDRLQEFENAGFSSPCGQKTFETELFMIIM